MYLNVIQSGFTRWFAFWLLENRKFYFNILYKYIFFYKNVIKMES